jgi:peroxin-19
MASLPSEYEIDAVLDAALDELDQDDDDDRQRELDESSNGIAVDVSNMAHSATKSNSYQHETPFVGPLPPPRAAGDEGLNETDAILSSMMKELLSANGEDVDAAASEFLGNLIHEIQFETTEAQRTDPAPSPSDGSKQSRSSNPSKSDKESSTTVDEAISTLIEDMAKQAGTDEFGKDDSSDETMLNDLMQGFAGMGEGFDTDAVIDGMMEQLVSKDLMYEPMKQVALKFPSWLKEKKDSITEQEYSNRCKQSKCFERLVHVYETEPTNTGKLMNLMQNVQAYGQPPREIIQEIAPGLEMDADGMPKLDASGIPTDSDCCSM